MVAPGDRSADPARAVQEQAEAEQAQTRAEQEQARAAEPSTGDPAEESPEAEK